MIRVGIIGLGYWGPNLARNFDALPDAEVAAICDKDSARLETISGRYPNAYITTDADELLTSGRTDAVAIVTPTRTHYGLAKQALEHGLHVFSEKPLTTAPGECEELVALAEEKGLVLFVGHIFLYTAAVGKLKDLVDSGELGDLTYISSTRLNLGPVRQDVNALWDLAPHDVSIVLYLMDTLPTSVNCRGLAYLNREVHDVTSLVMSFADERLAIVHSSWLDPNKTRRFTVVGSKKMAVYDDIEPLEKIKVYDKGIERPEYSDNFGEFPFSYRYGDTWSPRLNEVEPLRAECRHFIECVAEGKKPLTDGRSGLDVVRVLAAAEESLLNSGREVKL